MAYDNLIAMRVNDKDREELDTLAKLAETSMASFCRGGIKFFVWLWNDKHKDPRFSTLWDEWTQIENMKNKIVRG